MRHENQPKRKDRPANVTCDQMKPWRGKERRVRSDTTICPRCPGDFIEKLGDKPHAFPFSPPLTQNRYDPNIYSPFRCWDSSTTHKPVFKDIPFVKENRSSFFFLTVCLHSSIETLAYKIPRGFCCVFFFSFGATHSFAALTPKGNGALHN